MKIILNRFINFECSDKLKSAIWNFFTIYLPNEREKNEVYRVFEILDEDNDGFLELENIRKGN